MIIKIAGTKEFAEFVFVKLPKAIAQKTWEHHKGKIITGGAALAGLGLGTYLYANKNRQKQIL